ncbi:SAM hydrolase/SAM-dependent halogenase family protein [Archaeoglobus veneficus]|uniref:SAM-dependent chlorinase/fluorinase n=1 Tax=Archaeoglobus veneficus (strain DSM 11195 / SNP6) TaxID=693661 RepID=F2KQ22_ARCVS|nr:S-adenosyl-l-methionine hydroxide adenosyltransferase family protein [Archaeoglobus veneficus]AEA47625.1 protein of unknown function DUF62 [Archaeoglobus veneficus SNP6]
MVKKFNAITFLTDFGDFYPGVMKGVILGIAPDAKIIDITHGVEPQNVYQGAFLLLHSYRFFPPSIHVAVIDPGVGSSRRAIAIECKNHLFIGPDNGILYPACVDDGIRRVWKIIEDKTFTFASSSTTFHGRDVFAPAAALAFEGKLEDVAEEIETEEMKKLELYDCRVSGDEIHCRILFVDRFGNAVTNVPADLVKKLDAKGFYIGSAEFPLVKTYSCVEEGEPLALIGSFDTLELSVRNGDASRTYDLKSGKVVLKWRK